MEIALYHLFSRRSIMPPVRRQKYETAVAFLKAVAGGQAAVEGLDESLEIKEFSGASRVFGRAGLADWKAGGKAMIDFDWTALEEAVLSALQLQLAYQINTLESYQGDWRADLQDRGWRFPAVLVMLAGTSSEAAGFSYYDLTVDLTLLVVVRQLQGQVAGRRDTAGTYQLLAAIRQALWHQDLGLEILPLALVREEPLLNNREFSVYAAQYRTGAIVDF